MGSNVEWSGKDARIDRALIAFSELLSKWGVPPSLNELADEMRVSYATAHLACKNCLEAGLLERSRPGLARGFTMTSEGKRRVSRAKRRVVKDGE